MALRHLRNLPCQVGDFSKLSWQRTNANKRNQGIPEGSWIKVKSIRGDYAVLLQTRYPFRHCRTRHIDPSRQLGHRYTRVRLQDRQQL